MKKQPWIILCALMLSTLACSVFSGGVQQQLDDEIPPTPEATQDLRKQYKQTTPMATETDERSPSEEEPQRTSTSPPELTETPAPGAELGPNNPELEIYQLEENFDLKVVGVSFEEKEFGTPLCSWLP